MREARHYEKRGGGKVGCLLCPHGCTIADGAAGRCGARKNSGGKLFAATYGMATSVAMDPIEKKPLYHFHPGSRILSVGQNGCNLECAFCQNWHISRGGAPEDEVAPENLVAAALKAGSCGIAYTYNEPLIGFEFVMDTARKAADAGLANVLVTNGYVNPGPLAELLPFVHALNVDLKSIRDSFYRKLCKASVGPVQETLKAVVGRSHLEVTNLVIPGENDTEAEFEDMASWIEANLGRDVPLHLSAYFPAHKMSAPPTPVSTLEKARAIMVKKLRHVYLGNVSGSSGRDTICWSCGSVLIEREGYRTRLKGLNPDSTCSKCGTSNNIVCKAPGR